MPEIPTDTDGQQLNDWLARVREPALRPEQPIIDAHHHLWDRRNPDAYREPTPTHSRYLGDELMDDILGSGHNVIDTVFIECLSMYDLRGGPTAPAGEIEFVQGIAAMAAAGLYGKGLRCCSAIVGFAELTAGAEVDITLDALARASRGFRGIRQAHGWHASRDVPPNHHPTRKISNLLEREDFRAGFSKLEERGLLFECWGYHFQLPQVRDLALAFPGVSIVLDHIGGPIAIGPFAGQRETQVFDAWKRDVEALAGCPNVVAKLGGCGMPTYGFGFEDRNQPPPDSKALAAAWKPYFEWVIAAFGPERCMFESNFPVDKVSCSYGCLWNAFKRIAADAKLDPTQQNDLFYGTAARTYGISLPDLQAEG